MQPFSEDQSTYMADSIAIEQAIRNATRDGKEVVRVWKRHFLTLIIDDDPEESLNKNFYDIIDLHGKVHMVPGFTYEVIGDDQFRALVAKLESGEEL